MFGYVSTITLWFVFSSSFCSGMLISVSFAASHSSCFGQIPPHSSCSQSLPIVCSDSSVSIVRPLLFFLWVWMSLRRSRMHLLCAAVTTSLCPRHPALWMWPMLSACTSSWEFSPLSSLIRRHNLHPAVARYPILCNHAPHGKVFVTT